MATKKSSKSTASKPAPSKTTKAVSTPVEASKKQFKFERKTISIIVGILVIILALYLLRSVFIAGMVNGQPIFRITVVKELEKQGGKQVMESLVVRNLILQEAKKRNITLTDEDIENDLKKIEESYKSQGQTLDEVLALYNVTREDVIEQRRPWILLEIMLRDQVNVTDEEVAKYIEENREALGEDIDPATVKTELQSQRLQEKQQEFIQKLQEQAKVINFVQY